MKSQILLLLCVIGVFVMVDERTGIGSSGPVTEAAGAAQEIRGTGDLAVLGRGKRGVVGVSGEGSCAGREEIGYLYGVGGCGGANGDGVVGRSRNGYAGFFDGDVRITGRLIKGSGSFQIDHPLDPENKYLNHFFVGSPDSVNIYNGIQVLNADGEAWVTLPEWFEALNRDLRYQLTPIGAPAPQLHVALKTSNNRFKISGGQPGLEVSWQVTGVRRDAYAELRREPVEEWKPATERGQYLHPEAFGSAR